MARSFGQFGNALYTGETSINFIGKRKTWYAIAAILILIAIVGPILRGGFHFGIEFSGEVNSKCMLELTETVTRTWRLRLLKRSCQTVPRA